MYKPLAATLMLTICCSQALADETVPVKQAKREGVATCLRLVTAGANSVINDDPHTSIATWNSESPNKRMFNTQIMVKYTDGHAVTSLTVAPTSTNACDWTGQPLALVRAFSSPEMAFGHPPFPVSGRASMTTIFKRSLTCGHCGTENEVVELGSTNSFGSMDLDMRPPLMERDTLAQQIHRCRECGYCAPDLEEPVGPDGLLESHEYRALLTDENYPDLARKFVAYAFLAESSDDLSAAAWAYRNAAWACDDEAGNPVDSAYKCRNAVLRLMESLHLNGQSFTDDPITDSILELDLLRRSRQYNEALARAHNLSKSGLPEILQSISDFQQQLATAGDSSCYTVSDAFGTATDITT